MSIARYLLLPIATLSACVGPRPAVIPDAPPADAATPAVQTQAADLPQSTAQAQPLPDTEPRPRTLSPASRALVTQAQGQLNAGNTILAAATIERALRIEPDNPLLWIELAKIRQDEGNSPQAENLARKALSMARGDGKTQAAAWRVIAESYRARGRNTEARDAESRAQALGG